MKIVATILSGNAAGIIGDAIKSAIDFVDQVLLIDTGISDATIEIAKSIAGSKFAIAHFQENKKGHAQRIAFELQVVSLSQCQVDSPRVYRETRKDVYRTQNGDLPSLAAKLTRKCMAFLERSDPMGQCGGSSTRR